MTADGPVVLVVDDEWETRKLVGMNLSARGYRPLMAEDGSEALKLFDSRPIDLVLLDLTMPGHSGTDVCRAIRGTSDVPIVVLSGNTRESDKVTALDLGADDYVTKPFGVAELVARVGAALRRSQGATRTEHGMLKVGRLEIDQDTQTVFRDGVEVQLSATEQRLLSVLIRNKDRVLTHRYILQSVWGNSSTEDREYLRAYMYRLRRKLEEKPSEPQIICNVPGVGYRFVTGEAKLPSSVN